MELVFIFVLLVSDCDSTDSSEELRRGRAGRPSKLDKARAAHLYESNYRVSPRCHASTKSLGLGIADIDDLEEAYLFQDERDLGLSALSSLPAHLARDEELLGKAMDSLEKLVEDSKIGG